MRIASWVGIANTGSPAGAAVWAGVSHGIVKAFGEPAALRVGDFDLFRLQEAGGWNSLAMPRR